VEEESVFQMIELIKKNWPEVWEKMVPEDILFFRIDKQLEDGIHIEVERFDILPGDFKVLFRLSVCGADNPQSPTAIYKNLGLTSGGLTKILHRLEDKGLIDRLDNPDDRRSTLVKITSSGVERINSIFNRVIDRDQEYFSVLDKEERKTLTRLFEKLLRTQNNSCI